MIKFFCLIFLLQINPVFSVSNPNNLLTRFSKNQNGEMLEILKQDTLKMGGASVPTLVEVMKSDKYPDRSRWVATFLLARIMGVKSSDFLIKFTDHPNWVMRLASLKALLALNQSQFENKYAQALKDEALLVRLQSLENISKLGLANLSPNVWAMLYDQKNYYQDKKQKKKRADIIKKIILTVGDLKFKKAQEPLLKMIQKPKYEDIFQEMDYSLSKIVGKKSPEGSMRVKRYYWSKLEISNKEI
jgi:hypothetical protein